MPSQINTNQSERNETAPRRGSVWQPGRGVTNDPIIDPRLLDLLLEAREPVEVARLSSKLKIPVATVSREVERLREACCELVTHPQRGVKLKRTGLESWRDYLQWKLSDGIKPERVIEVYRSTTSTQEGCKRLIESCAGKADGALVIAEEQTAGRGRLGRKWVSPAGAGLTFSFVHACGETSAEKVINRLIIAVAVALARGIEETTSPRSPRVRIKWPNDLMVDGKKLGGILVETVGKRTPGSGSGAGVFAIVGVGINVEPMSEAVLIDGGAGLSRPITNLRALGCPVDRLKLLARAMEEIDRVLEEDDLEPVIEEWRRRDTLAGKNIKLLSNQREYSGQVIDLDPVEGLVLRTVEGVILHLPAGCTTIL